MGETKPIQPSITFADPSQTTMITTNLLLKGKTMSRPPVLIENWLPIAEVGVESMRERGASSALPPLYFLHVWWARRPLIASRAAILASVLPQWSEDWPADLSTRFPNEQSYHEWFIYFLGIRGNPVQGMKLVRMAKAKGIQLQFHPYGGAPRAFTINPSSEDLDTFGDLIEYTWGSRTISMLDPFAGGGSIPFEALRYGMTTYANDLNPVAATILRATLDYPARYGPELTEDIKKWGSRWVQLVKERLEPYFPKQPNENIFAYLWARTVQWNGRTVPLSPNWWLSTGDKPVAVRLIADPNSTEPRFEILEGRQIGRYDPDQGTINRGVGRCPWTGETIDGDYIKAEAQAGRMGQVLYAIVLKGKGGFKFSMPSVQEKSITKEVDEIIQKNRAVWLMKDIIPIEPIPDGNKTSEPRRYGEYYWEDSFTPRQLLTLVTYAECLKTIESEIITDTGSIKNKEAIITYLGISLDKAVVYNNRHCRFDPSRGIRSVFDRHDFAFVWSHAEFDGSANLLPWVVDQTIDAYTEITKLIFPSQQSVFEQNAASKIVNLKIYRESAVELRDISPDSIHNISVDPPYYDNVQYAELADFFYVWLKRSVGHLFPEFFTDELTNKDDEAVANPARFQSMGKKKKDLAEQDYQRKMAAAFREMHRVLHPDGVLTVMFTHKKVEAWDTLASALIGAGFTIKASWPVHTESEHSLHQAKKTLPLLPLCWYVVSGKRKAGKRCGGMIFKPKCAGWRAKKRLNTLNRALAAQICISAPSDRP
jgi:putative DNA methylase